jgi:hypothetical protein
VPPGRQLRVLALFVLFSFGCGPVLYLKEVSTRAAAALSQAKADGAEQYAPYEFTKAKLYYDQARTDAGRSRFESAIDWGKRSQDCSRRASALAREAQAQPGGQPARPNQTCGEL